MAAGAILVFEKFEILAPCRGQSASPCQISSKSVKRLRRYGWRFNGFQNGGRPPSWILEIQNFWNGLGGEETHFA